MANRATDSLTDLGLTNLEAQIYAYLLQSSPVTGYHVAKAIGKPAANTYQALESLSRKGAVVLDESGDRLCRAVAPAEFLGILQREFDGKQKRAERSLASMSAPPSDDGIYLLRTRDQVIERAHRMIRTCEAVLLLDISPGILDEFRPDLEKLHRRKIRVAAKLYRDERVVGVRGFPHPEGDRTLRDWPGNWLNIIADGREFLTCFIPDGEDEPTVAYWSQNTFLSWIYHSGLASEIVMAGIERAARDNPDTELGAETRRLLRFFIRLVPRTVPGRIGLAAKLTRRIENMKRARPRRRRPTK